MTSKARQSCVDIRILIGAVAAAVLLTACGSGMQDGPTPTDAPGSPEESVSDRADGPIGGLLADDVVGCRSGPWFPAGALDSVAALDQADRPEIEAAIDPFLMGEEGAFWPQVDQWSILHDAGDSVLLVAGDADGRGEIQVGFMTVEHRGGEWQWAGSSLMESCPLYRPVPEGLGDVGWRLDPAQGQPRSDSTQIRVLARERACAGGQPMHDRVIGPDVRETEDAVMISFAVRPLTGDQTCPGNPEMAFTIELAEPLGDRDLSDGRDLGVTLEDLLLR